MNETRRPTAFSLIEVILVVVIMGIVLAVAQPRFASAVQNGRVIRAATRLAADLRLAQSEAVRLQQTVDVRISVDSDAYQLVGVSPLHGAGTDYEVFLGADPDYAVNIAEANFDDDSCFAFDRYGTPDNAGTITLGIGRLRIDLTVEEGTGRLTIGELRRVAIRLPAASGDITLDFDALPGGGGEFEGEVTEGLTEK